MSIEPIVNPIKRLRLSRSWSLEQVAEAADLSKQLLIRSEQGCYVNIPPRLVGFLEDHFDFDLSELNEQYITFQEITRISNYGLLPVDLLRVWPERNPFVALRKIRKLSQAQVYKGFCIHPTIIHKLENQPNLCQTIPGDFVRALQESGYEFSWIAHYSSWYNEHKKWLREQVTVG